MPTLAEHVAMVRTFVDAQRARKNHKRGWFSKAEAELRKQMLALERD